MDYPFNLHINEDGDKVITIPATPPASENIILTVGAIVMLAKMAGINTVACREGVDYTPYWDTLSAVGDNIQGAYFCLNRERLSVVGDVPTPIKIGWEMALWYALSHVLQETTDNAFISISRVVSCSTLTGEAWSKGVKHAIVEKLNTIIRLAAQACAGKLSSPKSYLRGLGFFKEKFVGKSPQKGLYTEQEFTILHKAWETRSVEIEAKYGTITDTFDGFRRNYPMKPLKTLLEQMAKTPSAVEKAIEARKNVRIPMLLVKATKRQQNKKDQIAKGSSLGDKIVSIKGGKTVHTCAKVLYSPLYSGLTETEFVQACLREAKSLISEGGNSITERIIAGEFNNIPLPYIQKLQQFQAAVSECAQLYLEFYPDREGEPAWDAALSAAPEQK